MGCSFWCVAIGNDEVFSVCEIYNISIIECGKSILICDGWDFRMYVLEKMLRNNFIVWTCLMGMRSNAIFSVYIIIFLNVWNAQQ